jgi:hypothetical protein
MAKLSIQTQASSILKTYILHIANSGVASYKTTLSFLMDFLELNKNSYEKSITAYASGGQASATQLTKRYNRIDTCASTNDSVKLLQAYAGLEQEVYNNTSNDVNVYPYLGDNFLGLSTNTPILLVAGQSLKIFCYEIIILSY